MSDDNEGYPTTSKSCWPTCSINSQLATSHHHYLHHYQAWRSPWLLPLPHWDREARCLLGEASKENSGATVLLLCLFVLWVGLLLSWNIIEYHRYVCGMQHGMHVIIILWTRLLFYIFLYCIVLEYHLLAVFVVCCCKYYCLLIAKKDVAWWMWIHRMIGDHLPKHSRYPLVI